MSASAAPSTVASVPLNVVMSLSQPGEGGRLPPLPIPLRLSIAGSPPCPRCLARSLVLPCLPSGRFRFLPPPIIPSSSLPDLRDEASCLACFLASRMPARSRFSDALASSTESSWRLICTYSSLVRGPSCPCWSAPAMLGKKSRHADASLSRFLLRRGALARVSLDARGLRDRPSSTPLFLSICGRQGAVGGVREGAE